jgi:hypothetical protein
MPFPRTHVYLTFSGDAFTQQEIWQTGLRLDASELPTTAELEDLSDAYATLHADAAAGIGNAVRYLGIKAALIGPDGKYPNDTESIEYLRPTPLVGGGPGIGVPQLSTVLTLNTTRTRGKGSVGRMYLPSSAFTPQPDGRMAVPTATALAQAGADFIDAINSIGAGAATVFGSTGAGTAFPVAGVRAGRVIDTQRRRRSAITEEYVTVPLGG